MGDNKSETKLPDGVTLSGLTEKLNLCNTEYSKAFNIRASISSIVYTFPLYILASKA